MTRAWRAYCNVIRLCNHNSCKMLLHEGLERPMVLESFFIIPFLQPCEIFTSGRLTGSIEDHKKMCPECAKADIWVKLCAREDGNFSTIRDIKLDTYICSRHFIGDDGPTEKYPNPIPPANYRQYPEIEEPDEDNLAVSTGDAANFVMMPRQPRPNASTGAIPKIRLPKSVRTKED